VSHSKPAPTADAPVNPCKGGRANWKTAKKTRNIGNSAENNRAEQGQNSESAAEVHWGAHDAPTECRFDPSRIAFSFSRERDALSQQKTRRGHPPGTLHNSDQHSFLPKSRYVVKQKLPAKATDREILHSKTLEQQLCEFPDRGKGPLRRNTSPARFCDASAWLKIGVETEGLERAPAQGRPR
jgi:hypothetical protein